MFKKLVFNLLTAVILIIVFLYFGMKSWNKFAEMKISTEVKEKKVDNILYPSITVCPEKTLKSNKLPSLDGTFESAKKHWKTSVR